MSDDTSSTEAEIDDDAAGPSVGVFLPGISGKILALVVAPIVLMAGLNIYSVSETNTLFDRSLEQRDRADAQRDVMIGAKERIKDEMAALRQAVGAVTHIHHNSLLSEEPENIPKTTKARQAATARIDRFAEAVTSLTALVKHSGLFAVKDALKAAGRKHLSIIIRLTASLPALFKQFKKANDRTLGLLRMEKFADARSNFVYEESERLMAINTALSRIAVNVDKLGRRLDTAMAARHGSELASAAAALGAVAKRIYLLLAAIAIALTAGAGWFAFYGFARPLNALKATMTVLAGGDKTVRIPSMRRRDEIGAMARTVDVFRDNMIENERLQAEQHDAEQKAHEAEKAAQEEKLRREERRHEAEQKAQEDERRRDLEAREAEREETEAREREAAERMLHTERIEVLITDFDQTSITVLEAVAAAASQMQNAAQGMSATADQTNQQASAVAAASEEATSNVQTVTSATEELSSSIQEIGRQVTQSNEIAQNAVAEAKQTNQKVEGLAEAAQKIGDVVNLINDIASQTNLLALNATIEAARAGDAGKGFAVVASEVKSLASQTSQATDEIGAQITEIQEATTDAVQAIQGIGTTIGEIGEIAASIASAVDEQSASTREIAVNVQQAAAGTQEVSGNIAQVTQAASESQMSSGQILQAADGLAEQGVALREEVKKFLEAVRAA